MTSQTSKTADAVEEYLRCKADPVYFVDNYCYIQDPNTGSADPFKTWDFQKELFRIWLSEPMTVCLKARQLGISWCACALALWLNIFYDNIHVLCISKTETKAYELISKIKFMYDRLPVFLKKETVRRNRGELAFVGEQGEEGSWVLAVPATPGAAVSYTATLVITDEWAEQEYAEELYTALKPTIDMGGRLIGISTGNAIGSFFHEVWTKARRGENGFKPIFLNFDLRPGRDEEWYERTKRSYPSEQDFHQQYPRNEVEAFLSAGGCPFKAEDFEFYTEQWVEVPLVEEKLLGHLPYAVTEHLKFDDLMVWGLPQPSWAYVVSFDPATGIEGRDYHAIQVLQLGSLEQVAEFRSRCDLDVACQVAWELALAYNHALLVWERTGIGGAVTNIFSRYQYSNLYQHEEVESSMRRDQGGRTKKTIKRPGFPATSSTVASRDNDLISAFRDHEIKIRSLRWLDEAKAFVRQSNGRYGATGRAHDDLVTSLGQGLYVAFRLANTHREKTQPVRTQKHKAFGRERWK